MRWLIATGGMRWVIAAAIVTVAVAGLFSISYYRSTGVVAAKPPAIDVPRVAVPLTDNQVGISEAPAHADAPMSTSENSTGVDSKPMQPAGPISLQRATRAEENGGDRWTIVAIVALSITTLLAVAVSFYLYRWRRILRSSPHMLVPEELGAWLKLLAGNRSGSLLPSQWGVLWRL